MTRDKFQELIDAVRSNKKEEMNPVLVCLAIFGGIVAVCLGLF